VTRQSLKRSRGKFWDGKKRGGEGTVGEEKGSSRKGTFREGFAGCLFKDPSIRQKGGNGGFGTGEESLLFVGKCRI